MQFKKDNKCILYILKALHLNSKNKGIQKWISLSHKCWKEIIIKNSKTWNILFFRSFFDYHCKTSNKLSYFSMNSSNFFFNYFYFCLSQKQISHVNSYYSNWVLSEYISNKLYIFRIAIIIGRTLLHL